MIWIFDEFIRPPGPKMMVCVEAERGFFFRINTRDKWQVSVRLPQQFNPFLDHDSYLECASPLEFDDYIIDVSLRRRGVIGSIDRRHVPEICSALQRSRVVTAADRDAMLAALRTIA